MSCEIAFAKYKTRGAYHWEQVLPSIRRHNAYVSARYEVILSALGEVPNSLILDIGGGDGLLSYLIARQGARTITVDPNRLALQLARAAFVNHGIEADVAEASGYALPFAANTFDAAVCSDVIEHVRAPEQLLAEAARVLQPGGSLVLTTPLRVTETPFDHTHVHEFFAHELQEMLSVFFADVRVKTFAPLVLLELFNLPWRRLGGRPMFRYLFNAIAIYLRWNPFVASAPFRYLSMIIATGRKR